MGRRSARGEGARITDQELERRLDKLHMEAKIQRFQKEREQECTPILPSITVPPDSFVFTKGHAFSPFSAKNMCAAMRDHAGFKDVTHWLDESFESTAQNVIMMCSNKTATQYFHRSETNQVEFAKLQFFIFRTIFPDAEIGPMEICGWISQTGSLFCYGDSSRNLKQSAKRIHKVQKSSATMDIGLFCESKMLLGS